MNETSTRFFRPGFTMGNVLVLIAWLVTFIYGSAYLSADARRTPRL